MLTTLFPPDKPDEARLEYERMGLFGHFILWAYIAVALCVPAYLAYDLACITWYVYTAK